MMPINWGAIKEWFDPKQLTPNKVLLSGMVLIFISAIIFTSVSYFDYSNRLDGYNKPVLPVGPDPTNSTTPTTPTPIVHQPGPSHVECRNRQCVSVPGAGLDFIGCRGKQIGASCSSGGGGGGGGGGGSSTGPTPGNPQCSDGSDNDGDGASDFPNDFSCSGASDDDETNPKAQCQDGIDNDGDGKIDYPADLECVSLQDNSELLGVSPANYLLTVNILGTGTGSVTGDGLTCSGNSCTGTYSVGSSVNIGAITGAGSVFSGWGGACSGTQPSCTVEMTRDQTASASFNLAGQNQPPQVILNAEPTTGNAPLSVSFNVQIIDPDGGSILSVDWDFGDEQGFSTTTPQPSPVTQSLDHTYLSEGQFLARVTAVDDEGEQTTEQINIIVSGSGPSCIGISNVQDLDNIRNNLGATYCLTNDIIFEGGESIVPIGTESAPFTGVFDGDGNSIYSLNIVSGDVDGVGLFGAASGEIKNVVLQDVSVEGGNNVGALVGKLLPGGRVLKSSSAGVVVGQENVGGLVGFVDQGLVEISNSRVGVTGFRYVGGLVGFARGDSLIRDDVVLNSYAQGQVVADDYMGGLVGSLESGDIAMTYASGLVGFGGQAEPTNVGGLVGANVFSAVSNSYYDSKTTGQLASAGGEARTTGEMYLESTYQGWDFANIWASPEITAEYPLLLWELPPFSPADEPRFFTPTVILVLVIHLVVLVALGLMLLFVVWQHKRHQRRIEMLMKRRDEAMLPSLKSPASKSTGLSK